MLFFPTLTPYHCPEPACYPAIHTQHTHTCNHETFQAHNSTYTHSGSARTDLPLTLFSSTLPPLMELTETPDHESTVAIWSGSQGSTSAATAMPVISMSASRLVPGVVATARGSPLLQW